MKLIGSHTSPYTRKVRIVLAEKKIDDYQFILEDVWSADTQIYRFNPLGKIPCLVMDDGGALFDSRVITEYADTLSPVARLIPPANRERVAVRCWEALADGLLDAAAIMRRIEATQHPPEPQSGIWLARQHHTIGAALAAMTRGLGSQTWCHGNRLTLADLAVGCALSYLDFRQPQIDWRARHPKLAALHARLEKRPSFAQTQPQ